MTINVSQLFLLTVAPLITIQLFLVLCCKLEAATTVRSLSLLSTWWRIFYLLNLTILTVLILNSEYLSATKLIQVYRLFYLHMVSQGSLLISKVMFWAVDVCSAAGTGDQ